MKKQTLEERLKLYVTEEGSKENSSNKLLLAASAVASVGAILIPPPADAAIVYSGVRNKVVSTGQGQQQVDFNGDRVFEFTFTVSGSFPYTYSQKLGATGIGSVIKKNTKPVRLASNYMISNQKAFFSVNSDDLAIGGTSAATGGNFLDAQGYLGVKFTINIDTHYGWIQYKANSDASVGTIIDWAYEDSPDAGIKAGDTGKKFNWNLFLPAITAGKKNK